MRQQDRTDFEWRVIDRRCPTRRGSNGIFWLLRSRTSRRGVPDRHGPHTTCYDRFVRWRKAGVSRRLMSAIAAACDGKRANHRLGPGTIVLADKACDADRICEPIHDHFDAPGP